MRPGPRHLQLHLFEPAQDARTIPHQTRTKLLPLIIALLNEAADAGEPTAAMEADDE